MTPEEFISTRVQAKLPQVYKDIILENLRAGASQYESVRAAAKQMTADKYKP